MYIPKHFATDEPAVIKSLIADYGFGILLSSDLEATHLPLLYEPGDGQLGCLFGHFAKANKQWQQADKQKVLVIFQGPHAYISPSWYQSKPAVPTWNYVAVHCYGYLQLLTDSENQQVMTRLVAKYEPELLNQPDIMPDDYQAKLRHGVVGFKIILDDIQAKEKLGQHRAAADQAAVYSRLQHCTDPAAMGLAAYMAKRKLGTGS